jgi:hypothetical protein
MAWYWNVRCNEKVTYTSGVSQSSMYSMLKVYK